MGSLGAIVKHSDDFYPLLKLKMASRHAEKQIPSEPQWAFCFSMLHKVSRSFALVIQQLDTQLKKFWLRLSNFLVELAKRLVANSFADRVFFTNFGTEANEAAIMFSRKFQRFIHLDEKHPATEFISFTNSFHGRTMGALALTGKEYYRSPFEPVMPGVTFLEHGDIHAAKDAAVKMLQ